MKYTYLIGADENGHITSNVVEALSSYNGELIRGVAKCNPEDEFDLQFGMKLAAARCGLKVAEKRMKRATAKYNVAKQDADKAVAHLGKIQDYYCDAVDIYDEAALHLSEVYSCLQQN